MTAIATKMAVAKSATELPADSVNVPESTRLFVSGLPPKFTSEQLKQHFGSSFNVTDAHVLADRRIGFVGFVDSSSAQNAAKHFNRSFIRMSKISVDLAKPVQVSRDQAGNSVPISQRRSNQKSSDESRKRKRPSHDDGESLRESKPEQPLSSTIKQQSSESLEHVSAATEDAGEEIAIAAPSDSDWLRGRTTRTLDLVDPDDIKIQQDDNDGDEAGNIQTGQAQAENLQEDSHAEKESKKEQAKRTVPNARLFLRNLAFTANGQDLRSHFSSFGKVLEIHLVKDSKTLSSKGTGFVQFSEPYEAEAALQQSDGVVFQGRILHLLPASDKRDKGLTEFEISQMPLKKQKAIRRKMEAAKQTFSWNSLYMNPDAVLSSVADRLGVSKSDILDPTSSDAAVKQAHAETQLIKETKDFLVSAGVNIDAFQNGPRDDRCLLLKNFPYGTTEAELRALVEPFGEVSRFILPPAGTMALVQFAEPAPAIEAIKNLAYKNIKGSVLYIEKAPKGILESQLSKVPVEPEPAAFVISTGPAATVFVKNLNFSTTTTRLQEITSNLPGYISARVKTKVDPKKPGQVLSMGFGFVEFTSKSEAEAAVKALSGHQLDGHALIAQLSSKNNDAAEETRKHDSQRKNVSNQTKIIIKNLPFQVSKKDIRALFAQYGELKMVRLPRKFDNSARGFAFAEFVTPKEAQNAMNALSSTHLLGRRLVLQFAESDSVDPEEEIRAIEKKVEQQSARMHMNSLKGPGRKKFNLDATRDDDLDA